MGENKFIVVTREWCERTSAHGFPRLFERSSYCYRFFWMLIILAFLGLMFSVISTIVVNTINGVSISTNVEFVRYKDGIEFPVISLCDNSIFDIAKLRERNISTELAGYLALSISPLLPSPAMLSLDALKKAGLEESYQRLISQLGGSVSALFDAIKIDCADMILQCYIGFQSLSGEECCSTYFDGSDPLFSVSGICYTTSGMQTYKQTYASMVLGFGLSLRVRIATRTEFPISILTPKMSALLGNTFSISDGKDDPLNALNSKMSIVSPSSFSLIELSRKELDRRRLRDSFLSPLTCIADGENDEEYRDRLKYTKPRVYTEENCQYNIYVEAIHEDLNCFFFTRLSLPETRICTPIASIAMSKAFTNLSGNSITEKFRNTCPEQCEKNIYGTASITKGTIGRSVKELGFTEKWLPVGDSLSQIQFYYSTFDLERLSQSVPTLGDLIGSFILYDEAVKANY